MVMMLLAIAAVACGGPDELDMKAQRRRITTAAQQAYAGATIGAVSCPEHVEQGAGHSFTCTVEVGGAKVRIKGEQPKKGQPTFAAQEAVITKASAEGFVAAHSTIPQAVDCGPEPVHVVAPNGTIDCTVAFGDGSRQAVTLRVADVAGTVTIELPT